MILVFIACKYSRQAAIIKTPNHSSLTGDNFYKKAASMNWKERDSLAALEILGGNMPAFLKKFTKINTQITNNNGKVIKAYYYVMTDYLSIGAKSKKTDNKLPLFSACDFNTIEVRYGVYFPFCI